MGRAMIIICAATLISLGIVSLSTSDQGMLLTQKAAEYANEMTAKNAAHTAIQIAMQKISEDSTWADNHGPSSPWITDIDGAIDTLYVEYLNSDHDTNDFWESDSLQMVSKAVFAEDYEATVTSLYLMHPFSNLVPGFKGALTIPSDKVNLTASGSSSVKGAAPSGSGCENKPGITAISDTDSTNFSNELSDIEATGDPLVDKDTTLSYQPTDELIERLSNTNNVTYLTKNYKGDMGTSDDPGVFFVTDTTSLTGGISDGYGILVIRAGGEIGYEGTDGTVLETAGNFTFNGLVIFENAFELKARGTASISGTVLVGNTEDYTGGDFNVDINGNMSIQYDCRGENYAKKAAANAVKQNKYTRVVTFEETGF